MTLVETEKPEDRIARERTVTLGTEQVTMRRITTRDALTIAHRILSYGRKLQKPFEAFSKATEGSNTQSDTIAAGLELMGGLAEILEPDDFLDLGSRILGIETAVIESAPLEDVLNAIADAFELNDMPALLQAARRIWNNAQKITRNNNT